MHPGLVFFHGWGLSPAFWQPLATRLARYPQVFADAGYFGPPQSPPCPPGQRWVGIGHSLGFARALRTAPPGGWAALVSVAGFARFCPPADNAMAAGAPAAAATANRGAPLTMAAQPRRVVERMLRVHARDPHAVLAEFLQRCALGELLPPLGTPLQADRLAADLALLLDVDVTAALAALEVPLLALAARDDPIVPAALTEATFAPRRATCLHWHTHGGHALGYADADACAATLHAFVERL